MSIAKAPYRLLARWVTQDPEAWIALGNTETRWLRKRLPVVNAPVYVTGLARSGTTILTEALSRHAQVATHRYRDFPCLFTPYLWNRFLSGSQWLSWKDRPRERAHQDGIFVTPNSPESMEEMLWTAFFTGLHDESRSNVLEETTSNPSFESFYREHLQKLLLVRKRTRYVSKANYNLTRIPYLSRLFPDARFVVTVRHPVAHVWSLHRMHQLFLAEQKRNPATLTHMDQSGHFEFGLHRTLIHVGDDTAMAGIVECFAGGDDIRGWARYWTMMHRFIRERYMTEPNVYAVRQETLRTSVHDTLERIFSHAGLGSLSSDLTQAAVCITPGPADNVPDDIRATVLEETREEASRWGY